MCVEMNRGKGVYAGGGSVKVNWGCVKMNRGRGCMLCRGWECEGELGVCEDE